MAQHKFISFHTGYYDVCENTIVKCQKVHAKRFMEILPKLNEFVMLLSMNGGSVRLDLSKIEISMSNNIKIHDYTDCSFYNKDMQQEYDNELEENGYNEEHVKYELSDNKYGVVHRSRNTDIYESVMNYCILHIVWQILKYNTKFKVLNKTTTKICLKSNGQTVKKIVVPKLICDQWLTEDFLTISPVDYCDIALIPAINNLYDILEYVRNNEDEEKIIVFKGDGDYDPSYIKQNKNKNENILKKKNK
ncbi:putative ORFan [Tupanvirus deep ocean]|uniref:ORFan n=2 Tax=Tupanvirus TaxID=2094720 RepID=A0AC62A7C5_9VIRU|nr:putative ORFan [Tupanvirus deep ocean]QKU33585.1 putative ORFan [Tupanvirus deep ocean]